MEIGVADIISVMDAVGSAHADVFGFTDGVPLSILFAASYPERLDRLILWCPTDVRGLASDEFPWGATWDEWQEWIELHENSWATPGFMRQWFDNFAPSLLDDPSALERWARFFRLCESPRTAAAMMGVLRDSDVISVLPSVQAETLVLQRTRGNANYPLEAAEFVAGRIDDARLIELPGHDAMPHVDPDLVIEAIEEFLTGHKSRKDIDRVLATVLFTDIVDSTRHAATLGDGRWRELLALHDETARFQIDEHRGSFINTTGDGILATFDGPARAVRCAQSIGRAVEALGLEIRAGVHTGEVELLGNGDVGGIAVHIGARIAAQAGGSEVLTSQTVKDLTAGSGLEFEDDGEHELKGVPDRWRLYRVTP
jgi:class 3 adenylate cyclase